MNHLPDTQTLLFGLIAVALAISFVTDLKSQLIYNWVTFPTMGLALLIRLALGGWGTVLNGWGLASGLVGLAVGFGFFLIPYLFGGGVKEGDVKLAGAVGAAVGFPVVVACLVCTTLIGGLEAVLYLIWKGKLFRTLWKMVLYVGHRIRVVQQRPELDKDPIPYGVAIAIGTVWGAAWMIRMQDAW